VTSRTRILAAVALVLFPLGARAATLEVAVNGVRSAKGFVRVAVCSRATFLTDNCEYVADAPAVAGKTVLHVPNVAPGVYAVQVFDDDKGGGVIHQGLFGIPREGIGFSNDARLHLRGPKFDEAAVTVADGANHIALRLRYLRSFRPTEANLAGR
jgi:uncharacterized protein (DUF2141 family)